MANSEYSFFSLTPLSSISFVKDYSTIEFENKIWKLTNEGNNSVDANVFKLYWIDLINYSTKSKIFGKIDEVEIWITNNNSILVFTSSFSIVNLVRHFFNTELKLVTKIISYKKSELINIIRNQISSSLFIIDSGRIIKFDTNKLEEFNEKFIFGIEYFDNLNKVIIFISTHGMVKLSYGASELIVKKVCDELELNK